jgi:poly(3-hydroxybutyrate) depolymerase
MNSVLRPTPRSGFTGAWNTRFEPTQFALDQVCAKGHPHKSNFDQGFDFADTVASLWPAYSAAVVQEWWGTAVPPKEVMPDFELNPKIHAGQLPPVLITEQTFLSMGCRLWDIKRTDNKRSDINRMSTDEKLPDFLIVQPDSGSQVEIMNPSLHALLPYGNVRVLQWMNPHYVPAEFSLGIESRIKAIVQALRQKPHSHIFSDSQSTITATAATSWMYQNPNLDDALPASLTVISGPLDASLKPHTSINWMATHTIGEPVPVMVGPHYPGAGRFILPGNVIKLFWQPTNDKPHRVYPPQALDNEFLRDTLKRVFREFHLARGSFTLDGQRIDPASITCPVLAFAGSADDICTWPQNLAIENMAPNACHTQHVLEGIGHYGMISPIVMTTEVAPRMARALGLQPTWPVPLH